MFLFDGDSGFDSFRLTITGPNKAPLLDSSGYSFNISEGATNGDLVGTVTFTDEGNTSY